ncbi:hypothetical protein KK083_31655 [Fulvivirgaceae bacterium PWU4]|uniref:Uncharacterized protein n=1 Tax=Chryseosolibacter histidini TaxID=2782349 RepID=A0AAP2DS04_9BACT|nr:hypothetical protein [Chryseosolibacter histidini]MBT1701491.1 hypothetical protein [Chryseosolibacter histidini]
MNKFIFFVLLLSAAGCQVEQASDTWETDLYPDSNNIPRSVISLPSGDGYLVLGQKFTEIDSIQHASALVKLSQDGKVLKETFFGGDRARLVNISSDGTNRIVLAGVDDGKLWIRRVDEDLNVVSDTVFSELEAQDLYYPKVLFDGNDLIVLLNAPLRLIRMTDDYRVVWNKMIRNEFCNDGTSGSYIMFHDAFLDGKGNIVVTGEGHPFQEHDEENYNYDAFFAQLDVVTGKQKWFRAYGNGEGYVVSRAIVAMNDKYYATGMARNNDGGPTDYFDVYVYCLANNGELLWAKSFGGSDTEWGNDLEVFEDRLKIVGYTRSSDGVMSGNNGNADFYVASMNAAGEDLEVKVFGSIQNDELNTIENIGGGHALLLGNSNLKTSEYGNAWKIIKVKDH